MYSVEQEKEILYFAKELIGNNETGNNEDAIEKIRQVLNYADWKYYVQDNPTLSDYEYDTVFKLLKNIEEKNPNLITPDSPTQRVAKGLTKEFPTVAHLVPMLSLENSYNEEDLLDWDRKCRELLGEENIEYCVETKLDGASISLIYENDILVRAATRGNGIQGDDITVNAKQIRSIPLKAMFSNWGIKKVEIRGEVIITKKDFTSLNEQLIEKGLNILANSRNAASGSLRIKDSNEVKKRKLTAFLYHISHFEYDNHPHNDVVIGNQYNSVKFLNDLGFKTSELNNETCSLLGIKNVISHIKYFETKRDDLPYEIDGMVIKVNHLKLQEKIGQTSHHPRWAIAYKFKARQGTSKLLNIEYQVGRTGSVTPVAKIEPVFVGGVTISSISLFNEDVVREKDLRIGDTILIERAGDVIPYIVKSFAELRTGAEQEIVFPTHCPVCNDKLYKPEEEAVWRCTNINCDAQVVERIIHYASKDAMDIRGLGDANIKKFFDNGYLKHISDIYKLPFADIETQEGFGTKSIEKLKETIEKTKQQPLNRLIFALGIRYVGETTAKTLARSITNLKDLYSKTTEELLLLEDVGVKVAQSIVDFFAHQHNIEILNDLETLGVNFNNTQKNDTTNNAELSGKTFLFTGTLATLKRSQAEQIAEQKGATIIGSVSSKLNYLVVGEDAGSKLEKAKKLGTVTILTEEEFLKMVE